MCLLDERLQNESSRRIRVQRASSDAQVLGGGGGGGVLSLHQNEKKKKQSKNGEAATGVAVATRSSVVVHRRGDGHAPPDLPPPDQTGEEEGDTRLSKDQSTKDQSGGRGSPPVLLHAAAEGDLLAHLGAHRVGEDDLGQVGLDGADASARGQGADVHHQHLVLGQLLDLGGGGAGGAVRRGRGAAPPVPPERASPWRPSCRPPCGRPGASAAGSRRSPAR